MSTCIVCTFFILQSLVAQDLIYKIPLAQQVQSSSQIVEGKVISKQSFWDSRQQNIYTSNTVEVYKVFKGQPLTTIEIITKGGTVGLSAEIVTPSLQLDIHDMGIFTLNKNTVEISGNNTSRFMPYSGVQGFYKYNPFTDIAVNPFHKKQGISNFYTEIEALTGTNRNTMSNFNIEDVRHSGYGNRGDINISSFTPTTATAGTQTVLTINGVGFGDTVQNVGFANSNDGGATFALALPSQILSWEDQQVTVEIPSQAGTGPIALINSEATAILAASATLDITYAELNAVFDPDDQTGSGGPNGPLGFYAYPTQHINANGNGGYIWQMHTDFDNNTAAKASFLRAFDTWRCETDIYWTIGEVTAEDVIAGDGINIIRFDNGNELAAGTLGVCTSRFAGCFVTGGDPEDMEWFVSELDIVFNDTTNWEFGPANASPSEIDFETVAVHELGHGHQLGHVVDNTKIMHFSIGGGTNNRILSASDIAGGNDVQSRSTTLMPCGAPVMTNFDCSTLTIADNEWVSGLSVYPNPAKDLLHIKNTSSQVLEQATIYDVRGRLILTSDLNASNGLHQININQLHSGLYILQIDANGTSLLKKVIVE